MKNLTAGQMKLIALMVDKIEKIEMTTDERLELMIIITKLIENKK